MNEYSLAKVQLLNKYREFIDKFNSEKNKFSSVLYQLENLDEEIKNNRNLLKAHNFIQSNQVSYCPVCHQEMPISHDHEKIEANNDDLKQNVEQLNMQKAFLQSIKTRLEKTIEEKTIYLQYYDQLIQDKKMELQEASKELGDNQNTPSRVEMFNLAKSELRLSRLKSVIDKKTGWEEQLNAIYSAYSKNKKLLEKMGKSKKDTLNAQLNKMELGFVKLVTKFEYESNNEYLLALSTAENSSYCYFPTVQIDGGSEQIRSMSSASDFVRSIWSYYLTLMNLGSRHPGFLIMDEPGQQSIRDHSLQLLFKYCSGIKGKQIILFCSSTKRSGDGISKRSVDKLLALEQMKEGQDYQIHRIKDKSVDILPIKLQKL